MPSVTVNMLEQEWTLLLPAGREGQVTYWGGIEEIYLFQSATEPTTTEPDEMRDILYLEDQAYFQEQTTEALWGYSPKESAKVTVTPVETTTLAPPVILEHPVGREISNDNLEPLKSHALDWDTMVWFKDSKVSETVTPLNFEAAYPRAHGIYFARYSNAAGSSSTNGVSMILPGSYPTVTIQPVDTSVSVNTTLQLSVAGTNYGQVEWFKDGESTGVLGATGVWPMVQRSDAGEYYAILSNGDGYMRSDIVTVTVTKTAKVM